MSTLICKINTKKCKYTTNIGLFKALKLHLKPLVALFLAVYDKNTTSVTKFDK